MKVQGTRSPSQLKALVQFTERSKGKPYKSDIGKLTDGESYFCSELAADCLLQALAPHNEDCGTSGDDDNSSVTYRDPQNSGQERLSLVTDSKLILKSGQMYIRVKPLSCELYL